MGNRRNFLKSLAIAGIATGLNISCSDQGKRSVRNKFLVKDDCLKITGTFIDELTRDLPSHNWGIEEWDKEFELMRAIGIDTILLRYTGLDMRLLYPSAYLTGKGIPHPSFDKLGLLLSLADKWGFKVYCGLYNSVNAPHVFTEGFTEINHAVSNEIWGQYGERHRSFAGWFINHEVSVENSEALGVVKDLCHHCKSISGGKQVVISPWFDGNRLVDPSVSADYTSQWSELLSQISSDVDICTIQDTSVNDIDCAKFYQSCREIAQNHGIKCWGNAETYDVQMPVRLYSTDFDHLRVKLNAAKVAGLDKVVTYEFSHFMSPQSVCRSGACLFDRYKEYFDIT